MDTLSPVNKCMWTELLIKILFKKRKVILGGRHEYLNIKKLHNGDVLFTPDGRKFEIKQLISLSSQN